MSLKCRQSRLKGLYVSKVSPDPDDITGKLEVLEMKGLKCPLYKQFVFLLTRRRILETQLWAG
jgi:hypothetical protein